jgi:hypothetical protein
MKTHYTLQTKDHKIALREQDITLEEFDTILVALKHYYTSLVNSMDKMFDAGLDDVVHDLKNRTEEVRQLRRKLDGRD